jgi:hypothetical protein
MKVLFNPFRYVAGLNALLAGVLAMIVTMFIAYFSNTHFDGTIDIHYSNKTFPMIVFASQQLIAWGTAAAMFYLGGIILSKSSIRFVDIAGTIALSRIVLIPAALLGFLPAMHIESVNEIGGIALIGALIIILLSIWMIALMYNAFVVSCNLKGAKAITGFIISLLLAETLSKVLNYQLFLFYS